MAATSDTGATTGAVLGTSCASTEKSPKVAVTTSEGSALRFVAKRPAKLCGASLPTVVPARKDCGTATPSGSAVWAGSASRVRWPAPTV